MVFIYLISKQVHYILNELVMGGMVLETNMNEILTRIEDQNKLEKQEVSKIQHLYKQKLLHFFHVSHYKLYELG